MSKKVKLLLFTLLTLFIIGAASAFYLYRLILVDNVKNSSDKIIFIPTGSQIENVLAILDTASILKNLGSFKKVAKWMNYEEAIIPGKYTIKPALNNRELVGLLRSGNQTPVNLVINHVRRLEDLAGKIGSQIELDSLQLLAYLKDSSVAKKFNLNQYNFLSLFIPNTYQIYWTAKADHLVDRLANEHDKFWDSAERIKKAQNIDLSPEQVYTLASIVERETQYGPERPTVAGLYLNRLKNGIPLQADPTVVFATGIFDLRRVLNKHLEIDSPYNTYRFAGLPPGPIYMPSIQSIDAVLNAEQHDYLYMCARPDESGKHAFAASLTVHNQNANRYRQWLNQRGIK